MKYTEKQINALLTGIYSGSITEMELPESLYFAIADYLKKSLYEGFGGTLIDFTGKPLELLTELRENIYMFSGAKTYTEVKEFTELLYNEYGIKPFSTFKKEALGVYEKYNVDYLRTEYDTAIASGQQGYLWTKIVKDSDVLPYLKFTAVLDKNTTVECRHMDEIVARWDDKIWNTCYPPNHWHCRSSVLQTDEEHLLSSSKDIAKAKKETEADMQDVFKMNCGKDGYVFKKDHPYFDVAPKDKAYAKNNFNLPIPTKD